MVAIPYPKNLFGIGLEDFVELIYFLINYRICLRVIESLNVPLSVFDYDGIEPIPNP